jgi:excisionase family DNA binding protein
MTVREAASRLGISPKTVYSLCGEGRIVHERHGTGRGTIRITEEALEEYRRTARVEHGRPTPLVLKHLTLPSAASPS